MGKRSRRNKKFRHAALAAVKEPRSSSHIDPDDFARAELYCQQRFNERFNTDVNGAPDYRRLDLRQTYMDILELFASLQPESPKNGFEMALTFLLSRKRVEIMNKLNDLDLRRG